MHQDQIEISLEPIASTELINHDKAPRKPDWLPTSLKLPYIAGAVAVTSLHTVLSAILLVLKHTDSNLFSFSAASTGSYLFWQFVPMILAVVPGLMWEVSYMAACRMQPFRDLSSPQGVTLKDSLSQDYLAAFSWLVPLRALRHPKKHTALACIATSYLLSYGVLPTVTSAMIKIHWNDDYSPTEATAETTVYFLILALVVSVSTSVFALTGFSCFENNPPECMEILPALPDWLPWLQRATYFQRCKGCAHTRLKQRSTMKSISLLDPTQTATNAPLHHWKRDSNEAHPWWLRGRTYLGLNIVLVVPLCVLLGIMQQVTYNTVFNGGDFTILQRDFAIKICYTVVSLFGSALYSNWHLYVGMMQPYHELAEWSNGKNVGSSDAVKLDFVSTPIVNMTRRTPSLGVWWIATTAFLIQLGVIVQPAWLSNLTYTTVMSLSSSTTSTLSEVGIQLPEAPQCINSVRIIGFTFSSISAFSGLVGFFIVMCSHREPFLPRKPSTLSSVLLYLCHGSGLLEDLRDTSMLSKKGRERRLKLQGHKYGFGWMEGRHETARVGINRIENIGEEFKYPVPLDLSEMRQVEEARRLNPDKMTDGVKGWPEKAW